VAVDDRPPAAEGFAYQRIRRDLLSGDFEPGQRLRMGALCEHYGVSLSVVREALTRLAEQGLLRAERNRGFAAIPLSVAELEDLTFARVQIEEVCLRRSMARGDTKWEAAVVAAHYALAKAPVVDRAKDPESFQQWTEAHSAFHAALCSASASPRLLELRQSLFDATEMYRSWLRANSKLRRDGALEHQEILDAVLAQDPDKACALMTVHIMRTSDQLITTERARPARAAAG
jgi:DNA-binding GntR family transcriptional regulator